VSTIDLRRRTAGPTYGLDEGDPHDVALTDDGQTLWVTVASQRALLELDAETGAIRQRWVLPADGGWMVDGGGAAGGPVVVAHLEGGGLTLLHGPSRRIEFVRLAPGEIEAVLSPDGATVWSSNMHTDTITITALATRARVGSFPSGGRSPVRVLLSPDGRTAVVAHSGGTDLVLLDAADPRTKTVIPVPQAPKVLAVSSDGRRLYVSHPEPGGVSLIDLVARTLVRTVGMTGIPDGLAVVR
jgi:DNA-binding beta-propeller fold protein YncE